MRRNVAALVGGLTALLVAACGSEPPPAAGTDATTRALLNQSATVGGPATLFEGAPDVGSVPGRVYLPELGFNIGSEAAPLKLIEFSDFGCGYCRRFHLETFATLRSEFVDTDRIEWKFMPFVTGMFENSLAVTEAAECTLEQSPDAFEAFSDRLWAEQSVWKGSAEPDAVVRAWAADLAVDMERYDSCLAEDRQLRRVAGATITAQELGVTGTPTFWVVGYGPLQGALPLDVFQGVLSTVLEEVEAGPLGN